MYYDAQLAAGEIFVGNVPRIQDHKSLRVAVVNCATLVNTQTHRQTDR